MKKLISLYAVGLLLSAGTMICSQGDTGKITCLSVPLNTLEHDIPKVLEIVGGTVSLIRNGSTVSITNNTDDYDLKATGNYNGVIYLTAKARVKNIFETVFLATFI